jgi:N-carbamoylputrescine amidase
MSPQQSNRTGIYVAALQVQAQLGQVQANLAHFTPLVDRAAQNGAGLIVLPELAATGYSLSTLLWNSAETRSGATVRWARETAGSLGVYLGIGFVEAEGEDFFDAYVLAAPDGQIAGFVRKTMAETNLFQGEPGPHAIATALGKIGVGICADVHFVPFVRSMQSQFIDLLIMPHAWPGAYTVGGAVSQQDIERTRAKACGLAPLYAGLLRVPVILANLVGPRGQEPWGGLVGRLMDPVHTRFLGCSTIAGGDGSIIGQLDDTSVAVDHWSGDQWAGHPHLYHCLSDPAGSPVFTRWPLY